MFDEFGKEDDNWRPEQPKYIKILKKIPGILFTVLVFFIIGLMLTRLFMSKPPASMKEMIWTDSVKAAYDAHKNSGDPDDKGLKIDHILCSDSFSEDGMFSVSMITYCEEISQLQVTVRYNNRVLNYLEEKYPGAKEADEPYRFVLRDDKDKLYTSYSYSSAGRFGYTYRHIIFDGVTLTDVSAIYLDVHYSGDFDPLADARHTMFVYRYDFAKNPYELGEPEVGKYDLKTVTGE